MFAMLLHATDPQAPAAPDRLHDREVRSRRAVWRDRRIGAALVAGLTALAGLVTALAMPRGPVTTAQALAAMIIGFLLGGAGGVVLRSRWAMLLGPAVFVAVYELARVDVTGPTVDAVHWDMYGIVAFVVGRGFHGLLALVPMMLGAAYGAALARRRAGRPPGERLRSRLGRYARRAVAGVVTVGLVALGAVIAQPASTAPILGPDGTVRPGSVAELATLRIGGHDQVVMIRGRSRDNPVLLFLAGGPGGTDIGAMRLFGQKLEQRFTVATWDQRGTGKSRAALDPTSTYTLDRIVADTIEVTDQLRQRFGQQKIYLVGSSWGTTLGVLAVQRRPELFHAFVGTGQMVSQTETDRLFMEDTLAHARRTGNTALERKLRALGQSPYEDVRAVTVVAPYEREWNAYPRVPRYDAKGEMPMNLMVDEYSLMDKVGAFAGGLDTFTSVYPQLAGIDFRRQASHLDVPVYLVEGRHEARGRVVPARQWFDQLKAPAKRWITFEKSGHRPLFEEPGRFYQLMTTTVLPDTQPNS